MNTEWYVAEGEGRSGPHSMDQMTMMKASGALLPHTLVWRSGLSDWARADEHFDFPRNEPPLPSVPPVPRTAFADVTAPGGRTSGAAPARSFSEAISVCMSKFFTFSGRASRSEYWYFALALFLVNFVVSLLLSAMQAGEAWQVLSGLLGLVLISPSISVTVRRLHDTDRSGWWYGGGLLGMLVGFILVALVASSGDVEAIGLLFAVGFFAWVITLFVFMVLPGTPGSNRFD